ncbi:MAG: hypothetical protein WCV85_04085 [Patescibacteria group bacterium]
MPALSRLQRFILREALGGVVTKRAAFQKFYSKQPKPPSAHDRENAITKSIERLIDNGYLVGLGRRTPQRWFLEAVRLTPAGKKTAKRLLGQQQQFPFRRK